MIVYDSVVVVLDLDDFAGVRAYLVLVFDSVVHEFELIFTVVQLELLFVSVFLVDAERAEHNVLSVAERVCVVVAVAVIDREERDSEYRGGCDQ